MSELRDDLRVRLISVVTRDGKSHRIPELLDVEISQLQRLIDTYIADVIGKDDVDLAAKYEDYDGGEGIVTEIDDDESEELTGEKLAHLANFVADKTSNDLRAEQRKRAGL